MANRENSRANAETGAARIKKFMEKYGVGADEAGRMAKAEADAEKAGRGDTANGNAELVGGSVLADEEREWDRKMHTPEPDVGHTEPFVQNTDSVARESTGYVETTAYSKSRENGLPEELSGRKGFSFGKSGSEYSRGSYVQQPASEDYRSGVNLGEPDRGGHGVGDFPSYNSDFSSEGNWNYEDGKTDAALSGLPDRRFEDAGSGESAYGMPESKQAGQYAPDAGPGRYGDVVGGSNLMNEQKAHEVFMSTPQGLSPGSGNVRKEEGFQPAFTPKNPVEESLRGWNGGIPREGQNEGETVQKEMHKGLETEETRKGTGGRHVGTMENSGEKAAIRTMPGGRDAYFDQAARLVITKEKGSVGMLQRNFKIGYTRADGIMGQLEKAGIVSPAVGDGKPRQVLMGMKEYEARVQNQALVGGSNLMNEQKAYDAFMNTPQGLSPGSDGGRAAGDAASPFAARNPVEESLRDWNRGMPGSGQNVEEPARNANYREHGSTANAGGLRHGGDAATARPADVRRVGERTAQRPPKVRVSGEPAARNNASSIAGGAGEAVNGNGSVRRRIAGDKNGELSGRTPARPAGPRVVRVSGGKATIDGQQLDGIEMKGAGKGKNLKTKGVLGTKGIRMRTADTMKLTGRMAAMAIVAQLERQNETGEGLRKSIEYTEPVAHLAIEGLRRMMDLPGKLSLMTEEYTEVPGSSRKKIRELNRVLRRHGVETFDLDKIGGSDWLKKKIKLLKKKGKNGILTSADKELLETYKELLKESDAIVHLKGAKANGRRLREANKWLKDHGFVTINRGGTGGAILARRMYLRLKRRQKHGLLSPEGLIAMKYYHDMMIRYETTAFSKPTMRLRRVWMKTWQKLKKYLHLNESEAGRGLLLTVSIASGAVQLLKFAVRHGIAITKGATKAIKKAAIQLQKRRNEKLKRTIEKAKKLKNKKKLEKVKRKQKQIKKNAHKKWKRRKKRRTRREKFGKFKGRWNNLVDKLRDPFGIKRRMKRGVVKLLEKTKLGRFVLHTLAPALGAVVSVVTTIFNAILLCLLALILFIILWSSLYTVIFGALGSYDLSESEEKYRNAAINQIKECYKDDINYIAEIQGDGKYTSVNVTCENVINEEAYAEYVGDDEDIEEFTESTNFAEMMSMILVRFDMEFDGYTKGQVKKYARQLYWTTHSVNVVEHRQTYTDSDGNEHVTYTADVTFTTYYFDTILNNDGLKSEAQHNITTAVVSGSSVGSSVDNMYVYLRDNGYTLAGACGILGNIQQESNYSPTAGTGSYYGLFQIGGGRLNAMKSYCESNGLDYTTVDGQMQYFVWAMQTQNPPLRNTISGGQTLYNILTTTDDVKLAAEAFCAGFEMCVGGSDTYDYWNVYSPYSTSSSWYGTKYQQLNKRVNYAQELYNKYAAYGDDYSQLSPKGQGLVNDALQYVGNKYVWGGTSLTSGCDCSGFIMTLYSQYGISLPHSSSAMRSCGTSISTTDTSQWQPGDILCWPGHVGIYIGNTESFTITATNGDTVTVLPYSIVHASNSKAYPSGGIKVSGTGDPNYWKTYHDGLVAVVRIFN